MPPHVMRAIEERAEAVGFAALKRAATAMSEAYRDGRIARLPDAERTTAYLVTRMPASYAAAYAVLREVRHRLGTKTVASVLDIGAGTGAASLAARACFLSNIQKKSKPLQTKHRTWLFTRLKIHSGIS